MAKRRTNVVFDHIVSCLRTGAYTPGNGNEISLRCPNCGDDEGHFGINHKSGLYNCFKCPLSGNLASVILRNREIWQKIFRRVYPAAPPASKGGYFSFCSFGFESVVDIRLAKKDDKQDLLYLQATNIVNYCLGRGMTGKQIQEYHVLMRDFDSRAYFPYWDETGGVTFWMGRTTNDEIEPKTIERGNSQKPLYGRHIKIIKGEVVLLEGVFDHFVTPCSYALMGSNITAPQIIQLREDDVKRIFLIMDPDAGEQSQRMARKLADFRFDVFPVVIQPYNDPAKLGRLEMVKIVRALKRKNYVRPQTLYFNL